MKTPSLETEAWKAIQEAITAGITERFKAYNNPLCAMVDAVVASRSVDIQKIMEVSIDGALTGDFKKAIEEAVTHKLARVITSKMEGEIEKRAGELRASPEFRARCTLAVEAAIKNVTP